MKPGERFLLYGLIVLFIAAGVFALIKLVPRRADELDFSNTPVSSEQLAPKITSGLEVAKEPPAAPVLPPETAELAVTVEYIYPRKVGYSWYYEGALDYGRRETLAEVGAIEGGTRLFFQGDYDDLSDEDRDTSFSHTLLVKADSIETPDGTVILRQPFKKGSVWQTKWLVDGALRDATVSILRINGRYITTLTVVTGIAGYKNETYKEVNVYEPGKGLVYMEYTMNLKVGMVFPIWLSELGGSDLFSVLDHEKDAGGDAD